MRVIAVDFDHCLSLDGYPETGRPNWPVIDMACKEQQQGAKLILWTCREGKELQEAVASCKEWGLSFDAVNENVQEIQMELGGDFRKVIATEYWDDLAVPVEEIERRYKCGIVGTNGLDDDAIP